jgi:hypothetical protein
MAPVFRTGACRVHTAKRPADLDATKRHMVATVMPNVRGKRKADGMPLGPGYRKCTPYLWPGPSGMPLALRLTEGLGSTARTLESLPALNHVDGWTVGRGDDAVLHKADFLVATDGSMVVRHRIGLQLRHGRV